jgi:hypothetical protein
MSNIDFTEVFERFNFHDQDFIYFFNKGMKEAQIEQAREEMQERYDNRRFTISRGIPPFYTQRPWLDFRNEYEQWLYERK